MVSSEPSNELTAAVRALFETEYRMAVAKLSHLATHSNVLFRADLSDGRRLVLRVGQPGAGNGPNLDLEVAWLSELVADPEINVAEVVATPDGRRVVELAVGGETRRCVLFTWVPGDPMGSGAGTSGYRAMGRLSALLHHHGDWRPSAPSSLRRWDRTFYFSPEIEPVVIDDPRYDHLFGDSRSVLRRIAEEVDAALAKYWAAHTPMVVHGDLHEWNVHLYMGRAWAIDFEDVMLAFPAQDVATSLYGARTRSDLDAVVAAFRSGYEEYRRWPVETPGELEFHWAARQVMLMNHAACILSEAQARQFFDRVMPWLRDYADRRPGRHAAG